MPKKLYVGVDHVARKCKKMYFGALTDVPVYGEGLEKVGINTGNISDYFEVTDGAYKFAGSGSVFTSNNYHITNTTASTVLTAKQDISALSFDYSYSSEKNYDKFTLKVGGTVVENAVSGATTSKSYSGSLTKGGTIEFTYSKDSSTNSYDDKCTFSNMSIQVIGRTQIGTEQKSLARKVAKGYIGVGGVARPFFSGGEVVHYGPITSLETSSNYGTKATTVGNYAVFFTDANKKHNVYNADLVRTTVSTNGYNSGGRTAATTVGNHALQGGGYNSNNEADNKLFAISDSLTSTSTYLKYPRYYASATSVGDNAIFAGGSDYSSETAEAINSSLVASQITDLSYWRCAMAATTVGNYALFGGGARGQITGSGDQLGRTEVDAYDANLVHSTIAGLTTGRRFLAATSFGGYAFFGGGARDGSTSYMRDTVDIYDSNLVKLTPSALSVARWYLSATSLEHHALFSSGVNGSTSSGTKSNVVDVFDESLTRSQTLTISFAGLEPGATTIGKYALIGGPETSTSIRTSIDAYFEG